MNQPPQNNLNQTVNPNIVLAIAAVFGAGLYFTSTALMPPARKPEPKTPYNYTENELIGLIRGTGARCKEPAIVTPTNIPNGKNYLVACYANTGTYEITITQGSEPSIKKLRFN